MTFIWKFYSGCCYVGETSRIIDKMTNFWRLVFLPIIWLWATLCDTSIRIRENHGLLRLKSSFSESMSEYESVFRICVWIIIHHKTLVANPSTLHRICFLNESIDLACTISFGSSFQVLIVRKLKKFVWSPLTPSLGASYTRW